MSKDRKDGIDYNIGDSADEEFDNLDIDKYLACYKKVHKRVEELRGRLAIALEYAPKDLVEKVNNLKEKYESSYIDLGEGCQIIERYIAAVSNAKPTVVSGQLIEHEGTDLDPVKKADKAYYALNTTVLLAEDILSILRLTEEAQAKRFKDGSQFKVHDTREAKIKERIEDQDQIVEYIEQTIQLFTNLQSSTSDMEGFNLVANVNLQGLLLDLREDEKRKRAQYSGPTGPK